MVRFGNISIELCGGIHVKATGEIGVLLINQDASVAKGIRRIEAVSGPVAYHQITASRQVLQTASSLLASRSENLVLNIEKLKKTASAKTVAPQQAPLAVLFQNETFIETPEGAKVFIARLDLDAGAVQKAADQKMATEEADIVYLASVTENTIKALVTVTAKYQQLHKADVLLKNWLEPFGGKGGGKAALAKGGIKEADIIDELMGSLNDVFNVF